MLMMPTLQTPRLLVRPFVMEDLPDIYQLLDVDLGEVNFGSDHMNTLTERAQWLNWTILSYEQLAKLDQPPYGDRAVVLRSTGQLVGACGFVPCLNTFEQLPSFASQGKVPHPNLYSTQFGLFYAISPSHQRQGYATEAAYALVQYAFQQLRLGRIVATTDYDNVASIGVMRKIGMRIEHNPLKEPPWFQVVGILETHDFSHAHRGASR